VVLYGGTNTDIASTSLDETARVRHQLERAERFLVTYEPNHLTGEQQIRRSIVVDLVADYRERGIFPHHHDPQRDKALYFVDEHGTPCALASVIARTGRADIVEAVRSRMNGAWVHDIMDNPDLRNTLEDWLDENGLTFADAATIQVPGYTIRLVDEESFNTGYAVASGLSVGTGAVFTAINLTNLRSPGSMPVWFGVVSGATSLGLGVANLGAEGPRLAIASVDLIGGLVTLGTSLARLLTDDDDGFQEPPLANGRVMPEFGTDSHGKSTLGVRFVF
jgi:hypothetical protein